jgi:hypothetical protein
MLDPDPHCGYNMYTVIFLLTHNRGQIIAELVNFFKLLLFTLQHKKYNFFVIIAPKNNRAQDARKDAVTTLASKRTRRMWCDVNR